MNLIFLYGPPAAGKLTVARELERRTGYKLLHNHLTFDLLEPVFGAFHPLFAPLLGRLRLDIVRTAAEAQLSGLIVTHVYGADEAEFVRDIEAAVHQHGGHAYFIQLLPNSAELDRRVAHPDRHQFKKLRTPAELRELMANWDVLQTIPDVKTLTIDNSNLTPEQAADQILKLVQAPRTN